MKWAFAALALLGMVFAGQIVNVGETTDGSSVSPSPSGGADDSECYAQYFQCLREGCAAAGGSFNELTQGCYGGNDARFAEAVGTCGDAQGECVMGTAAQPPGGAGSGTAAAGAAPKAGGLCPPGLALLACACALFMCKV
jgi:hypothetical protein